MANRRERGRLAEDRAAEFLIAGGFTVVTRRFKGRRGEIDLVCLEDETLVFVEVKEWLSSGCKPEEAIGPAKMAALQNVATQYVSEMESRREVRFDLIAIDESGLRHHRDIFGHGV